MRSRTTTAGASAGPQSATRAAQPEWDSSPIDATGAARDAMDLPRILLPRGIPCAPKRSCNEDAIARRRTVRKKSPIHLLAAAAALFSFACATTTFQSTWKAPDAQPLRLTGQKVAAVFVSRNASVRRRAEDAMAREITSRGARGVPSYTVLSEDRVRDLDF